MKYMNKIGVMLSASFLLAAASCTDYSDYNTVPVDEQLPGANNTLWENIVNDQQLTKFAALASRCNFSEALNSPRFYTIWAPVDNAFSDEDYNRLMASDSATIVKQFMQQHITEYNYPVSAALDSSTIISLNTKHHPFTQTAFDGFSYAATNVPSSNGLLHKINGLSVFYSNLYENIDNLTGCDSIKNYIQKYDEYYLDVNASVVGPLVNGQQTYLDSVLMKRNSVINNIMYADLGNEDSTYCMLIPNDEAWSEAYAAIHPYYNYIPKMDYMDLTKKTSVASSTNATTAKADLAAEADSELQDSLTCRNIASNLVFSNWYQPNRPLFGQGSFGANDSILSTSGYYLTNLQDLKSHMVATNEMSNGVAHVINTFPFSPWDTYNPVIVTDSPMETVSMSIRKLTTHNIPLDSLAGRDSLFSKVPEMFHQWLFPKDSRFFSYVAVDSINIGSARGTSNSAKPEFDFPLIGVRSTTYHIYVVTVPAQVEKPEAPVKPYYLRFYLSWTDAANKQQYTVLPEGARTTHEITTSSTETPSATMTVIGDPGRVNVIDLGEFTFPASYYGLDAYPSLMMMHTKNYTSDALRNRYERDMRVAGVYLVPKEYNDYWMNSDNE